jgi:ABC-type multidrug transport system fused ATPase/permease subunit
VEPVVELAVALSRTLYCYPMVEAGEQRQRLGWRGWVLVIAVLAVAVAAVAVVVALLFVMVRAVLSLLASAAPEVLAAVIVTSGTILVSVASLILANRYQARQQRQQAQRERKAEVYEEMLEFWFWAMREREEASEEETKERDQSYYRTVPQKIVTWASEPVIKEYATTLAPGEIGEDTSKFDFEKVLLAIRRDLGHTNKGLKEGDLLRLFLTGVDEELENRRNA